MSYRYGYNDILVLPQDLQDFAWSSPMRDLAAKIGISDVGLRKLLKTHGVITPPQGHWNRVLAGKPVPKTPKAPARRPGETGRARVDARFAKVLTTVERTPSSGPFVSSVVPEDLEQLYAQELKAIGRAVASRNFDRVHHGLTRIFKREQQRREKSATERYNWDSPKFDTPLDQRRLKLFNAVFMTLSKHGHDASADERDGEIDATAIVGDTHVDLDIAIVGKHRTVRMHGRDRPAPDVPASTPLKFVIDAGERRTGNTRWQDDVDGKLESKIAEITAAVIVAGEAAFRRHLRESEELDEQFRRWEQQRRRDQIEAQNRERLKQLRESGDLTSGRRPACADRARARCSCRGLGRCGSNMARSVGAVGLGRGRPARSDRFRPDHDSSRTTG